MSTKLTTELRLRVYDDESGEYWEIGPLDGDNSLVFIRACDSHGKTQSELSFPVEAAEQFASALCKYLRLVQEK